MIALSTFLYYIFFASVVLNYCIGTTQVNEYLLFKKVTFLYSFKIILNIVITSLVSWVIVSKILVPLKLVELYPLVALFVYLSIAILMESIIRLTTNSSTSEFIFSYLVVLLAISESVSSINTLIIALSCFIGLLVLYPFIYAFKLRILTTEDQTEKFISRFMIFIAILFLVLTVWDVMWLNPGVVK